jgi:hypothetical protein
MISRYSFLCCGLIVGFFVVLKMEHSASHILSKCSTTEVHPKPSCILLDPGPGEKLMIRQAWSEHSGHGSFPSVMAGGHHDRPSCDPDVTLLLMVLAGAEEWIVIRRPDGGREVGKPDRDLCALLLGDLTCASSRLQ